MNNGIIVAGGEKTKQNPTTAVLTDHQVPAGVFLPPASGDSPYSLVDQSEKRRHCTIKHAMSRWDSCFNSSMYSIRLWDFKDEGKLIILSNSLDEQQSAAGSQSAPVGVMRLLLLTRTITIPSLNHVVSVPYQTTLIWIIFTILKHGDQIQRVVKHRPIDPIHTVAIFLWCHARDGRIECWNNVMLLWCVLDGHTSSDKLLSFHHFLVEQKLKNDFNIWREIGPYS